MLGTLSITRAFLNDAAVHCREKEGAIQLPCRHQDHECWLEVESISSCMAGQNTGACASMISDFMVQLPMLMTPQKIKKQKSHPTEEIIRFIT